MKNLNDDRNLELQILKRVSTESQISQRRLARELGYSLGKVNYMVKALIEKGLVKARNFQRSDNKWAYAYILTPRGIDEKASLTRQFLQRKMQEYDKLAEEIEELQREIVKQGTL